MKRLAMILFLKLFLLACATPGQLTTSTPQQRQNIYPPVIEDSLDRQQAAQKAWKDLLTEWRLPETKFDAMPVLNTPRALPPELAGRINLNAKLIQPDRFGEIELKEALRIFIERSGGLLCGEDKNTAPSLQSLSLTSFAGEGASKAKNESQFYRVVFTQVSYPFQIAEGYGELRFLIARNGDLLQWSSSLIPNVSLPTRAEIKTQTISEKLSGREFSYTTIAGRPQSYKVTKQQEIKVGELVIYPKLDSNQIKLHLAFPVVVGQGMTWTVYIDAINGEEIAVKQNFAS